METVNAFEKERTNSDTNDRVVRKLGESKVPAEPLLYQGGEEATRETEAETEEPKYVYVNESTLDLKRFKVCRGKSISNGDRCESLDDLLKTIGGHIRGIRLEVLVAFDEKRSNRRGEYARLDSIVPKGRRILENAHEVWVSCSKNVHI
jgi:hypothetical protein